LDIQYNRNEDFKTVICNDQMITSTDENNCVVSSKETPSNEIETAATTADSNVVKATVCINDEKNIETTVIFLPNVWSLMPNSIEYQKIVQNYRNFIDNPPQTPPPSTQQSQTNNLIIDCDVTSTTSQLNDPSMGENDDENNGDEADDDDNDDQKDTTLESITKLQQQQNTSTNKALITF
jgi:hypothetical protein